MHEPNVVQCICRKTTKETSTLSDFEPKKLALLRILQILEKYSDIDHPLGQKAIADILDRDYGIELERKAVSRNISLLKEAGFEIEQLPEGVYLAERQFEDSELRLLIDGVLSGRFISAKHSADLIEKLCSLGNKYFRNHVKNIYSVREWNKTDNVAVFYTIDIIDEAIENGKQIAFDFNRYGADKKLHRVAHHLASPYQMVLKNQSYYLMAYNEKWKHITYYRLDRITEARIVDIPATPLKSIDGFQRGIDYKRFSSSLPYMFSDKPERVEFVCDERMLDQAMDWFGKSIIITPYSEQRYKVEVTVSLMAMRYWVLQYLTDVELLSPQSLKETIKSDLQIAMKKYS